MATLNERLVELCNKRTTIKNNLLETQKMLTETQILIEQQTLNIKLEAINVMNNASQEDTKTIFSNESKRKLYIEDKIAKDESLALAVKHERNLKEVLLGVESRDSVAKIHERFLFKQIELYVIEKGPSETK